jgi:hydrogenase-1 operon protein HyaE
VNREGLAVDEDEPNAAPLVRRLVERTSAPWVDERNLDAVIDAPCCVLFLAGDCVQYPEALDVAVILPELLRDFDGAFSLAVARPGAERAIAARYGVRNWPSLVFFRAGQFVTMLSGMYDWEPYRQHVAAALALAPPARARVALPLAAADAGGCGGGRARDH